MIVEVSIAIAILAFVVLVIYLIITLCSLRKTLEQAEETLQGVNELCRDIQGKSQSLNSLFDAVELLGDKAYNGIEAFSSKQIGNNNKKENLTGILDWIMGGIRLWCTLKQRR